MMCSPSPRLWPVCIAFARNAYRWGATTARAARLEPWFIHVTCTDHCPSPALLCARVHALVPPFVLILSGVSYRKLGIRLWRGMLSGVRYWNTASMWMWESVSVSAHLSYFLSFHTHIYLSVWEILCLDRQERGKKIASRLDAVLELGPHLN